MKQYWDWLFANLNKWERLAECIKRRGNFASPMRDLFSRLSSVGFDNKWVRAAILPDWWEDELAHNAFNRDIAEAAICGHLGFKIRDLRDRNAPLPRPDLTGVCFKRNQRVDISKVGPSLQVVRRVAHLVCKAALNLPRFEGGQTAREIRKELLRNNQTVTLSRLVELCWGLGVIVIGVSNLPAKAVKFDGVAMFVGERPVVVLASGKDGPPWLTFDLAHELGHLLCRHVVEGPLTLVDTKLTDNVDDNSELEADEFALEILTGSPDGLKYRSGAFKAHEIGELAAEYARSQRPDLDPGMIVLSYCKSTSYWGVAKGGLESLGLARGGHAIVAKRLARNLCADVLSDPEVRFLEAICHLPNAVCGSE